MLQAAIKAALSGILVMIVAETSKRSPAFGALVASLPLISILAVIWLGTTGAALVFAMQRQFVRHRAWMLRSAALTFAAVTLRLYLGVATSLGVEFETAYQLVAWLAWVPNALVMETYLWQQRHRSRAISRKARSATTSRPSWKRNIGTPSMPS